MESEMAMFGLEEHLLVWYAHFGDFREWGVDCDRRLVKLSDYGKSTRYGWQIDHIQPKALGGSDLLMNKRPRHRDGNALAGGLLGNALNSQSEKPLAGLINALANVKP